MTEIFAIVVVFLVGLYFLVLAAFSLVKPQFACHYLLGFAASPARHYSELAIRLVAGWAFLAFAAQSPFPNVFAAFGWLLLVTTLGLLLVPWKLHRRFAEFSVPQAIRHIKLIAVSSLAMGGFVVYSLARSAT